MFKDNKYTTWYFNIINRARGQNRSRKQGYFEGHHITPKSLGGDNSKDNLVLLTAREHYICHLLLVRMLDGSSRDLMIFACLKLSGGDWYLPEGVVRSRSYESIRIAAAQAARRRLTGIPKTKTHKENLKKSFSKSAAHKIAAKQNVIKAHESNTGQRRPDHSKFMKQLNSNRHSEQFTWYNKLTGEVFVGSRIELQNNYSELRLDELWKVSVGKAKSHKGWLITNQSHLHQSSPEDVV